MSRVINFYGGPGTGKSTSAALLFAEMKNSGKDCELVQEYVKQWAWEQRNPVSLDQFYFFGKQARREYSLYGKVDTIITDSPVSLCAYYCKVFGSPEQAALFEQMTKTYYAMARDSQHQYVHVWLNRLKGYNPKGRFQTEAEALAIDSDMKDFLKNKLQLELKEVDGTKEAVLRFYEEVK